MMVQDIRTTLTELRHLRRRVAGQELTAGDWPVIGTLLSKEIARAERRLAKMLAKLEASEGGMTGPFIDDGDAVAEDEEDEEGDCGSSGSDQDGDAARGDSCTSPAGRADGASSAEPDPRRKGHGRNGAGAYVNAEHDFHALLDGILGGVCEACGVGRMSRHRAKLIVMVKGQPLFDARVHHFEQARCRQCGAIVRAEGEAALTGLGSSYIRYHESAAAMLLVMHYFADMPFKRLESLQAGWGIPLSDANQWSLADASADRLFPLYKALERHGVQNALALRIDDTDSMVIEVKRKIRAELSYLEALGQSTKDVRTAINATGVHLDTEQGPVLLFFTGRHHAGEIVDRILEHRRAVEHSGDKLVKVSDAASKNFAHTHRDELEEAVCNAHAYLKFRAVKDRYPEEHGLAGEVYHQVFHHDDVTRAKGMSAQERMLYHRKHSLPAMQRLAQMCREKLRSQLVEPNSPLWEPLTFIINQWERLTKFCYVPGVPLDTNVVEQMLIIAVRYLVSSFNYKTQNGAEVGDLHMSLIATANANGLEPVAYLTECLENYQDLARRPEYYLPWVYRARLEAQAESMQTGPPSAAANRSSSRNVVVHPLRPGAHRGAPRGSQRPGSMTSALP